MASSKLIFLFVCVTSMASSVLAMLIISKANLPVPSDKFFYAASISSGSKHICSSFILNKRWMITSALCMKWHTKPWTLNAFYGSHNRSHTGIISNGIERIVIHPHFDAKRLLNNLAMIKVKNDIQFIPTVVQAAILPTKEAAENDAVDAVGWEKCDESNQSDTPEILKYHQTRVMVEHECSRHLPNLDENETKEQVICTHATIDDTFPVLDNGSSLISDERGELIGIASWDDDVFPSVYVNVRRFLPWIRSVLIQ